MRTQRGFTLVELAVVTSIVVILLGLVTINLVHSQQGASLTATEETLIVDLRQQQLKAMIGDTEGRASSDTYGIHFDQTSYTLFHGAYSSTETTNFVVNLPNNMQFNNPGYDIIFQRLSGEIASPVTMELEDNTNSNVRKIDMNGYGVVNEVDSL